MTFKQLLIHCVTKCPNTPIHFFSFIQYCHIAFSNNRENLQKKKKTMIKTYCGKATRVPALFTHSYVIHIFSFLPYLLLVFEGE